MIVIDPDDLSQAYRLADALNSVMCKQDPDWDKSRAYEVRAHMRAALRAYADEDRVNRGEAYYSRAGTLHDARTHEPVT